MVSRAAALSAIVCAALLASACEPPAAAPDIDARAVLVRASLDMRGARPTPEEVLAVERSPEALEGMLDAFLADPRLSERMRAVFAPVFRTRQDEFFYDAESFGLDPAQNADLARAVGEEVPNLAAFVAASDRPFHEILTADYTVVDPVLLEAWPLEPVSPQPEGLPPGTVMARYTDGRPAAGVLATNAFYWRFTSTYENANRGRTNAIARALLCEDYVVRPIDFPRDVSLTDTEAIQEAISSNQVCQACHSTIDPIASHLWGFMKLDDQNPDTWAYYQPQNERLWEVTTKAAPAYFGRPTTGTLRDLALHIAADERFAGCMVRHVYEGFLGRAAEIQDDGQLAAHREVFLSSGLSMKALVRSVAGDPAYRMQSVRSDFGGTPAAVEKKVLSPDLLASSMSDLSGYRMTFDGREATSVDRALRALAGGSDRARSFAPAPGHALVQLRLAEASARTLADGAAPGSRIGARLAKEDLSRRPAKALLAALVLETRSRPASPEGPEVAGLLSLWDTVRAPAGPREAWTAVLTALLADPELAVY